jgi:hypothetical protein
MHYSSIRMAALAVLAPALLSAQSPKQVAEAGKLITPAKVLQRISVIADDSMGGRNTPSPGLEKTAQYLADSYKAWGLKPAGDNGTYFQRYPMVKKRIDPAVSYLEANEAGAVTRYPLGPLVYGTGATAAPITANVVIVAGTVTPADIAASTLLKGAVVLLVMDYAKAVAWTNVSRAVAAKQPAAIVQLTNMDVATFTTRRTAASTGRFTVETSNPRPVIPTVVIHDSAFNAVGGSNRPDWNEMRQSPGPVFLPAPAEISVTVNLKEEVQERVMVPNVVAMVEGSDPTLKAEYVVFSSHMDHVGTVGDGVGGCGALTRPDGSVDNICNGADDDASGTTGLLMVAEAWGKLKVKPKRSLIILNVSGEEKGLLGSAWYADHPTVPAAQIVANVNMDMIGRNATDSIVVIGKEHSDLGVTLAGVQKAHPELKLIAADDIWPEEGFYSRSDHFNFARKGVPVLFFFNGTHPQYHRPNDEVPLIDTSKLARVAQLGFYFGVNIANTVARPKWNPDSYQLIVVEQKTPPVTRRPTP